MQNDGDLIHQNFVQQMAKGHLPDMENASVIGRALDTDTLLEIFESQLLSRHLDLESRHMQARGESFYTIGSAGHEGNASIAAAFRVDDPALLHYRDAAFMIQRSKQLPNQNPMRDMLLSFSASSKDPISGGRHKVLGSKALSIPPQTSTIASHLPKALGLAASIGLNKRIHQTGEVPDDGIVICSFGDASLNHSTAQGAINSASWMAYQKMHLPLVFICEDNHIGISTPTPTGWVEANMKHKPAISYFACDGRNALETYETACEVEAYVRQTRMPAFIHMSCVRLMGHAGSDVQSTYLSHDQINETLHQDPLLYTARLLIENGLMSAQTIVERYQDVALEVTREAKKAASKPKITDATEVMSSIVPPKKQTIKPSAKVQLPEIATSRALPMSRMINLALNELMQEHKHIVLAGEDIADKGGVYGVTNKLKSQFGSHRVINTILDEQTILGLSIGMAQNDLLPIPEIQFLAYLHNAEDQLRGEAATLSFFSNGQYTNPMVIRIAGLAYQKGFGGHFHNDNSIAVLRDIPGVIVACPSNGADAVGMLRECVRLAEEEQRVVVFLEPIALYGMRDLHKADDELWISSYDNARKQDPIRFGDIHQHGDSNDIAIVTYGNGYYLSRQAADILEKQYKTKVRVIDLRWLHPLPTESLIQAVQSCDHILVVDECRKTGSVSEEIMSSLTENPLIQGQLSRLCAEDSFIPLGRASTLTLPSKDSIVSAALSLRHPTENGTGKINKINKLIP